MLFVLFVAIPVVARTTFVIVFFHRQVPVALVRGSYTELPLASVL